MIVDKKVYSLEERVYLRLEEEILSGYLKHGETLTENALANRLGVSRTPLRASLHRLAEEGLIDLVPNRGAVVIGIGDEELVDIYKILADGFTVPGVILIMLTALVRLSAEGAFDGLSYVIRQGAYLLIPRKYKHETYYDYKTSKGEKKPHGYSCMFYVGVVLVLIALVFVKLHSDVYTG